MALLHIADRVNTQLLKDGEKQFEEESLPEIEWRNTKRLISTNIEHMRLFIER